MMSLRITVCTSASAPVAQPVEAGARHGVAGGDDRRAVVLEAEPDARLDRPVIGRAQHATFTAPPRSIGPSSTSITHHGGEP